ncbi:hypothetical protein WA158_006443 [Blastocystis sp. Blastoise]
MNNILSVLNDINAIADKVSNISLNLSKNITYEVREASLNEAESLKPFSNKKIIPQQRKMEEIFEEMQDVINQYSLYDHMQKVEALKAQYMGLETTIKTLKNKINDYTGSNRSLTIESRYKGFDNDFKHEVDGLEAEVNSITESLINLQTKLDTLTCQNHDLDIAISQVDDLSKQCDQERQENIDLQIEIENNREKLSQINDKVHQFRTLYAQAIVNDTNQSSEIHGAYIQSLEEKQSLLKEIESIKEKIQVREEVQTKMRETHPAIQGAYSVLKENTKCLHSMDGQQKELYKKETAIKTLCAHFLNESSSPTSLALKLIHENGGSMPLSDLKANLLQQLGDSSKILSTIYTLVGQSLLKIDRSHGENIVISLIY